MRILLAEDNITNQQVALGMLKKLGYRADAVATGLEALKALESIPYDVVLMDVQMPEMDGLEATRRIRDPRSSVLAHDIPIIAMTAHAMQGDRARCLEAGMTDYLTKPIMRQAVADALERCLVAGRSTPDSQADPLHKGSPPGGEGDIVFDGAGVLERLGGDEALVRELIDVFCRYAPCKLEELKLRAEAGDTVSVDEAAQEIKGAAAEIGGEAIRRVAESIESAAKARDLKAISVGVPELERRLEELCRVLRQTA